MLNFGRHKPNLLSIPEKIGTDIEYPPRWSGLDMALSPPSEGTFNSDPEGRLKEKINKNVPLSHFNILT